jgi:glycosyltransferase involved in cell wall biosynthesis
VRVALAVNGRFHAFDLARAMLARGHDVTLMTNYPVWATRRFGVNCRVESAPWHGVTMRAALATRVLQYVEPVVHQMFGRWIARRTASRHYDLVHAWSGVAEELLAVPANGSVRTLMRGSAHILEQSRLLIEEEERIGYRLEKPSAWMIDRELREYGRADRIIVLSQFAARSFRAHGITAPQLALIPLAVDTARFRPQENVAARRLERIAAGEPLRVLYVGAVTYRKGLYDLTRIAEALPADRFRFTAVGAIASDGRQMVREFAHRIDFRGKVPQSSLPDIYAQHDVFCFPTIEDGFAVVLAQAAAAGLPILATENSAAPDLLTAGASGWAFPIRKADAFVDRLLQLDRNRQELMTAVRQAASDYKPRTWANVASDFERLVAETSAT